MKNTSFCHLALAFVWSSPMSGSVRPAILTVGVTWRLDEYLPDSARIERPSAARRGKQPTETRAATAEGGALSTRMSLLGTFMKGSTVAGAGSQLAALLTLPLAPTNVASQTNAPATQASLQT